MQKYIVMGLVDATVTREVEADSPEEAAQKAELCVSICHQCSGELDVGDVYTVRVMNENCTEQLWTNAVDSNTEKDLHTLVAYLKNKKRLPVEIQKIVDRLV